MTRPPLLQVVSISVKKSALAVISACLIYGGIQQFVSVILILIYPIATMIPHIVNAAIRSEFDYIPSLPSSFSDSRMWLSLTKAVAIGAIVVVMGIFVGLWANSRSQRVPVNS